MAAKYQLAADAYEGTPYSGVIRSDGKWVPCEAGNEDWREYLEWVYADPKNVPDPFKSVEMGGVELKLVENQKAVGAMVYSMKDADDLPPPPPRALPSRADLYTPPAMPTDASMPPANEFRSDAVSAPGAAPRETAPVAGVWHQEVAGQAPAEKPAPKAEEPRRK